MLTSENRQRRSHTDGMMAGMELPSFELLDRETCYRAFQSHDARFDGRVFVGVTSTGIYCRPICPARAPKFENCRYYASAAAAQESSHVTSSATASTPASNAGNGVSCQPAKTR